MCNLVGFDNKQSIFSQKKRPHVVYRLYLSNYCSKQIDKKKILHCTKKRLSLFYFTWTVFDCRSKGELKKLQRYPSFQEIRYLEN